MLSARTSAAGFHLAPRSRSRPERVTRPASLPGPAAGCTLTTAPEAMGNPKARAVEALALALRVRAAPSAPTPAAGSTG